MKIVVTGIGGQLGYDVMKVLQQRNVDCIGADVAEFDITNFNAANAFISAHNPDAVIHCAAYTAVDKAEDNQELCRSINVQGTENIANICKTMNAKMMYISTDYVFSGTGEQFYEKDDATGPLGVYGQTKLDGEKAVQAIVDNHFIIRVSWVFGKNGNNFIKTMLRLGKERDLINVVCDQVGSPTYTADLAVLLCDMIVTEKYGVYHATNEGVCSWAEFAKEVFQQSGIASNVNFIPTAEYSTRASRPLNSRMSKRSLDEAGFNRLPSWQDAVSRYLKEIE